MYIKNWLEYQNIMDAIYLENLKNQMDLKKLQEENFEQSLDLLQSQTISMNDFSISLFSSFNPKHEDIKKIKALWLEVLDMQRFNNLGVIKNEAIFNSELLTEFENSIQAMRDKRAWDKQSIVDLFFKMIPDFGHKETGKYLDGKM